MLGEVPAVGEVELGDVERDAEAARRGVQLLLLEVGVRNTAAYALYLRGGFTPRDPFSPYEATPTSRFLEKRLAPAVNSHSPRPAR